MRAALVAVALCAAVSGAHASRAVQIDKVKLQKWTEAMGVVRDGRGTRSRRRGGAADVAPRRRAGEPA